MATLLRRALRSSATLGSTSQAVCKKYATYGFANWLHPGFHAYFPSGACYASILGDIISDMGGCLNFSWNACPSYTELEVVSLDWLARAMGLPEAFLHECGTGGGSFQVSASSCIFNAMLTARRVAATRLRNEDPDNDPCSPKPLACYLPRLVAYFSESAHSCVKKAAVMSAVRYHAMGTDDNFSMRGVALQKQMEEDMAKGLVPFFVCATLGTTDLCSFDNVPEIAQVRQQLAPGAWLHVDAAYAGSALLCPEFSHLRCGFEHVDSFNMNPYKWLHTLYDCAAYYVRDAASLIETMSVDPVYLHDEVERVTVTFRNWGIPLSRRLRGIKLWFMFRDIGIEALQEHVRKDCCLAKYFEELVLKDDRFEVVGQVTLGLVCFRLCASNEQNRELLAAINNSGELHLSPAIVKTIYILRVAICCPNQTAEDMDYSWKTIQKYATKILKKTKSKC